MSIIEEIAAERRRQIGAEGFSPALDDSYESGELALAGAAYARMTSPLMRNISGDGFPPMPGWWPWEKCWWKPTTPRRDLIKAAALIVAEIERLDRLNPLPSADGDGSNAS